jgi:transposase-like protein
MGEALSVLLGDDAKGLSANVVSRLKAQWADEHVAWSRRDMSESHYVYWWVDGIHTGLRSENSDGQCLLVIIGVKPDGSKERVAIGDGYRETKASWLELLLDLKKRGLKAGPRLAVGDGAMGFWAALEEVFPTTRGQRCWFHKMGNVLNALPVFVNVVVASHYAHCFNSGRGVRSGLSQTSSFNSQLRVEPDQRCGLPALACA